MCSETLLNDSESGSNDKNTNDEDTCKKTETFFMPGNSRKKK